MDSKREWSHVKRSAWAGAFVGIGIMAGVDEIIFHQILSWHHFYDRATIEVGLMTDAFLQNSIYTITAGCSILI